MNLKKTYRNLVREANYRADLRELKRPSRPCDPGKRRILFFAPEAAIDAHFHMMCVTAKILAGEGHDVWITRCQSQFERCPAMAAHGLPHELSPGQRKDICGRCTRTSYAALRQYRIPVLDLRSLADVSLQAEVDRATRTLPHDLANFHYDGYNFGGISQYEVRLEFKQSYLDMDSEQVRGPLIRNLRSTLTAYLLVRRAIQRHGFTDVVYCINYGLMLAAHFASRKEGIRSSMLTHATHRNLDRRRYTVYTNTSSHHVFRLEQRWARWREVPLPTETVGEIGEEIMFRFLGTGSHIFSTPKSLEGALSRSGTKRRRVVAYTSSPDEYVGAYDLSRALEAERPEPRSVFGGSLIDCHLHWLEGLCRHAEIRPDIDFVIRIHPREGSRKGISRESQHLSRLRACLKTVPANCTVIWPDDPVSSYDLGETADLVLVSWSTIGVEMARLGLPVLRCTDGVSGVLADHFQSSAENAADYFRKIDALLATAPSFERIRYAYRWWNYQQLDSAIDLSDLIPAADYGALPPYRKPARAADLTAAVLGDVSPYETNFPLLERHRTRLGEQAEEIALRMQCRRIFRYLLEGKDGLLDDYVYVESPSDGLEAFIDAHPWLKESKKAGVALRDGGQVVFFDRDGKETRRHSPMAAILGFFGATSILVSSAWEGEAPSSAGRVASLAELKAALLPSVSAVI